MRLYNSPGWADGLQISDTRLMSSLKAQVEDLDLLVAFRIIMINSKRCASAVQSFHVDGVKFVDRMHIELLFYRFLTH